MKLLLPVSMILLLVPTLGENNLRALKQTNKNNKKKTVAGFDCDKSCMEEIRRCDNKCDVKSGGSIECKNGKLPRKCKQECCDETGGGDVKEGSKGGGITAGAVQDIEDLEDEVEDLEDKVDDLEKEMKELKDKIKDVEDDVEDIEKDCC